MTIPYNFLTASDVHYLNFLRQYKVSLEEGMSLTALFGAVYSRVYYRVMAESDLKRLLRFILFHPAVSFFPPLERECIGFFCSIGASIQEYFSPESAQGFAFRTWLEIPSSLPEKPSERVRMLLIQVEYTLANQSVFVSTSPYYPKASSPKNKRCDSQKPSPIISFRHVSPKLSSIQTAEVADANSSTKASSGEAANKEPYLTLAALSEKIDELSIDDSHVLFPLLEHARNLSNDQSAWVCASKGRAKARCLMTFIIDNSEVTDLGALKLSAELLLETKSELLTQMRIIPCSRYKIKLFDCAGRSRTKHVSKTEYLLQNLMNYRLKPHQQPNNLTLPSI